MSDRDKAARLQLNAERCRRLAREVTRREDAERLLELALEYEAEARAVEAQAQQPAGDGIEG
jgi:hypothetical protein